LRTSGLDQKVISRRLRALQQVVGALTETEVVEHRQMGEWAGVSDKGWGAYVTGRRPIPPHAAVALKLRWGVSLDWIYAGDASKNEPSLQIKLDEALRNLIPRPRGRKATKNKRAVLQR
jgi:hypothetical protein